MAKGVFKDFLLDGWSGWLWRCVVSRVLIAIVVFGIGAVRGAVTGFIGCRIGISGTICSAPTRGCV